MHSDAGAWERSCLDGVIGGGSSDENNNGIPSAERIIPEYQNLKVGDFILPLLQVAQIESQEAMLWIFLEGAGGWSKATWSWGLYKTDHDKTRLVSRLRQTYTSDSLKEIILWGFQDVTEIFMMRTSLLGIKRRAEETYQKEQIDLNSE